MSAVAYPTTKPGAARPPIPPHHCTGFNPGDSDEKREPYYKVLAESVRQLLKAIRYEEVETLPLMRRLVADRKRIVELELACERMMAPEPLPPLLKNFYVIENHDEDEPIRVYKKLLAQLDQAAERIDKRLQALNGEVAASLN
jgi:hypothetical protein